MLLEGRTFDEILDPFSELLERLITSALVQSGPVDEVQVIGGASSYRFVVDTIEQVTNQTIRRDFNANEAIALGAVAATITDEGVSPYVDCAIDQLAFISMNVTCGSQTKVYCRKGGRCEETIEFENVTDGCDGLQLIADAATIPEGCETVLASYRPTKKCSLTGNVTVRVFMRTPEQIIDTVQWCDAGGVCEESRLELLADGVEDFERALGFLTTFLDATGTARLKTAIRGAVKRLAKVLKKIEEGRADAVGQVTEEMKEKVEKYKEILETDRFESYGNLALEEAKEELDKIAKALRLDWPDPDKDEL
jgi:molecular chaperone DnaK (HSP70)